MAIKQVIWKSIAGILLNSCFFFVGLHTVKAQPKWNMVLSGTVSSLNEKSKMSGVNVTVIEEGAKFYEINTDANGKFKLILPSEAQYLLEFNSSGYVTKRLALNLKNVPSEFAEAGDFPFAFDLTLFKEMQGLDVSVLSKPLAEITYDPSSKTFNYNKEYSKWVKPQLEQLQADLEARLASQHGEGKEE